MTRDDEIEVVRQTREVEAWDHEDTSDAPFIEDGPYCDYCETEGHTFASCPKRDDHDMGA